MHACILHVLSAHPTKEVSDFAKGQTIGVNFLSDAIFSSAIQSKHNLK